MNTVEKDLVNRLIKQFDLSNLTSDELVKINGFIEKTDGKVRDYYFDEQNRLNSKISYVDALIAKVTGLLTPKLYLINNKYEITPNSFELLSDKTISFKLYRDQQEVQDGYLLIYNNTYNIRAKYEDGFWKARFGEIFQEDLPLIFKVKHKSDEEYQWSIQSEENLIFQPAFFTLNSGMRELPYLSFRVFHDGEEETDANFETYFCGVDLTFEYDGERYVVVDSSGEFENPYREGTINMMNPNASRDNGKKDGRLIWKKGDLSNACKNSTSDTLNIQSIYFQDSIKGFDIGKNVKYLRFNNCIFSDAVGAFQDQVNLTGISFENCKVEGTSCKNMFRGYVKDYGNGPNFFVKACDSVYNGLSAFGKAIMGMNEPDEEPYPTARQIMEQISAKLQANTSQSKAELIKAKYELPADERDDNKVISLSEKATIAKDVQEEVLNNASISGQASLLNYINVASKLLATGISTTQTIKNNITSFKNVNSLIAKARDLTKIYREKQGIENALCEISAKIQKNNNAFLYNNGHTNALNSLEEAIKKTNLLSNDQLNQVNNVIKTAQKEIQNWDRMYCVHMNQNGCFLAESNATEAFTNMNKEVSKAVNKIGEIASNEKITTIGQETMGNLTNELSKMDQIKTNGVYINANKQMQTFRTGMETPMNEYKSAAENAQREAQKASEELSKNSKTLNFIAKHWKAIVIAVAITIAVIITVVLVHKLADRRTGLDYRSHLREIDVSGLDVKNVVDFEGMFACNPKLIKITLYHEDQVPNSILFQPLNGTNFSYMFQDLHILNDLDLQFLSIPKAENLSYMFANCYQIETLNVTYLFTEMQNTKAVNMASMFQECTSLQRLDFLHETPILVSSLNSTFAACGKLEEITGFKCEFSSNASMYYAFFQCITLGSECLDLTEMNTSNVSNMEGVFKRCIGLTHLIIDFDTSSTTNKNEMFLDCHQLRRIYCEKAFSVSGRNDNIFKGCYYLVGESGYRRTDDSNINNAHLDYYMSSHKNGQAYGLFSSQRETAFDYIYGLPELETYSESNYVVALDDPYALKEGDVLITLDDYIKTNLNHPDYDSDDEEKMEEYRSLYESDTTINVGIYEWLNFEKACHFGYFLENKGIFDMEFGSDAYYQLQEKYADEYIQWYGALATRLETAEIVIENTLFSLSEPLYSVERYVRFKNCLFVCQFNNQLGLFAETVFKGIVFDHCMFVGEMDYMFKGCKASKIVFENYCDTAYVSSLTSAFQGCEATYIDLRSFDSYYVAYMRNTFRDCPNLTTIYISDKWSTKNMSGSNGDYMFLDSTKLVGTYITTSKISGTTATITKTHKVNQNQGKTNYTFALCGKDGYMTFKDGDDPIETCIRIKTLDEFNEKIHLSLHNYLLNHILDFNLNNIPSGSPRLYTPASNVKVLGTGIYHEYEFDESIKRLMKYGDLTFYQCKFLSPRRAFNAYYTKDEDVSLNKNISKLTFINCVFSTTMEDMCAGSPAEEITFINCHAEVTDLDCTFNECLATRVDLKGLTNSSSLNNVNKAFANMRNCKYLDFRNLSFSNINTSEDTLDALGDNYSANTNLTLICPKNIIQNSSYSVSSYVPNKNELLYYRFGKGKKDYSGPNKKAYVYSYKSLNSTTCEIIFYRK